MCEGKRRQAEAFLSSPKPHYPSPSIQSCLCSWLSCLCTDTSIFRGPRTFMSSPVLPGLTAACSWSPGSLTCLAPLRFDCSHTWFKRSALKSALDNWASLSEWPSCSIPLPSQSTPYLATGLTSQIPTSNWLLTPLHHIPQWLPTQVQTY